VGWRGRSYGRSSRGQRRTCCRSADRPRSDGRSAHASRHRSRWQPTPHRRRRRAAEAVTIQVDAGSPAPCSPREFVKPFAQRSTDRVAECARGRDHRSHHPSGRRRRLPSSAAKEPRRRRRTRSARERFQDYPVDPMPRDTTHRNTGAARESAGAVPGLAVTVPGLAARPAAHDHGRVRARSRSEVRARIRRHARSSPQTGRELGAGAGA
jgi:hypothetical protein